MSYLKKIKQRHAVCDDFIKRGYEGACEMCINFIYPGWDITSTIISEDSHIVRIYSWIEDGDRIIKTRIGNWLMDPYGKKDLIDLDKYPTGKRE